MKINYVVALLIMFLACGCRQTQTENAVGATTDRAEETVRNEADLKQPQNLSLTGTIGEDNASIVLEKNGSEVMGIVTRCDFCEPFNVEGTWRGDCIKVEGFTLAGSHIKYELTVAGNAVQGLETLSAEGEVEEQDVAMTIG